LFYLVCVRRDENIIYIYKLLSHFVTLCNVSFQVGTKATKYKKELKGKLDTTSLESSVRGPEQVLACSALAVVCSLLHSFYYGQEKSIGNVYICTYLSISSSFVIICNHKRSQIKIHYRFQTLSFRITTCLCDCMPLFYVLGRYLSVRAWYTFKA